MTAVSQLVALLPPPAHRFCGRVQASTLGRRLVRGTFWSIAGTLVARGMGLAASIVVARALGKIGFGGLGVIQSTVGMFGVLAGLGLGTTATKYVAEFRSTDPVRVGRIVALSSVTSWVSSTLMAVALYAASPWLAANTLNNVELVPQLRIGALLLLLGGVNGAQTGTLTGFEAFRTIARINFAVGFLNFPCLVVGVWLAGLTGAVWGLVVNLAANCLFNFISVRRELRRNHIPLGWRRVAAEIPLVWRFSLPVMVASLAIIPANWITTTFLARSSAGYAGLGEFSAANQWRNMIVLVPAMLGAVTMPMLSNLHGLQDRRGYRKVLLANLGTVAAVAGAAAVGVAVFAVVIARSYGPSFENSAPVIRWMAACGFLIATNTVVGNAITSLGRAWTGAVFCLLCASALLASAWMLVPISGACGLALASVIAYCLHTVWQGLFLWRAIRS